MGGSSEGMRGGSGLGPSDGGMAGVALQSPREIREVLQNEIDEFIAAECPFCGEAMVRKINMGFIAAGEEEIAHDWTISDVNA